MTNTHKFRAKWSQYKAFAVFFAMQLLLIPSMSFAASIFPPNGDLNLLQPLDDSTKTMEPSPGIQIFFEYFNLGWPWVLGIAAGIGVFWAIIGGVEIMLSGSDSKSADGKSKIEWAIAGLLMIGLAGFILRSLNPIFFK